jgi:hypothetical protein
MSKQAFHRPVAGFAVGSICNAVRGTLVRTVSSLLKEAYGFHRRTEAGGCWRICLAAMRRAPLLA